MLYFRPSWIGMFYGQHWWDKAKEFLSLILISTQI